MHTRVVVYGKRMLPQGKAQKTKKNLNSQAINHYVATFQDVSIGMTTGLEATNVLGVFIPPSDTIVWEPSSSQTFTAAKKALWRSASKEHMGEGGNVLLPFKM